MAHTGDDAAIAQGPRARAAAEGDQTWRAGLREAWLLARPFWRERSQRAAWAELAAVLALTLFTVWINVRFNAWNSAFYDALQAHDLGVFWQQIGVFALLAAAYIASAVFRLVLQQQLVIRWRQWMTNALLEQWLRPGTAYRLEADRDGSPASPPDNPDQRIAEDVRSFVTGTLELGLGLVNSIVTLLSFVAILWLLSGALKVPWPHPGWALPGYMVWVALAYSWAGTWLAKRIGAPLIAVNANQQKVEADFRYALVQVRDQAEPIALARGEPAEQRRLQLRFDAIRANWLLLIRYTKRLTWFSAGYGQLANVFPLLAAAPRYFAGSLQLGGLMQTAQAFGQVQGALSWFVDAYSTLADWRATVLRLAGFRAALQADRKQAFAIARTHEVAAPDADLIAQHLVVALPHGPALLRVPSLWLRGGESLLISGASGSGKSSLLRTLAGLWPARQGRLRVPRSAMFVAQRPWLPDGTLAEALAYPLPATTFNDVEMIRALVAVGLDTRVPELRRAAPWARMLSPGEQQRLQFARVFVHRPRFVLLDEASSALDEAAQEMLYVRLRRLLPATAVLSIGHRRELAALHRHTLTVEAGVLAPALSAEPARAARRLQLGH